MVIRKKNQYITTKKDNRVKEESDLKIDTSSIRMAVLFLSYISSLFT